MEALFLSNELEILKVSLAFWEKELIESKGTVLEMYFKGNINATEGSIKRIEEYIIKIESKQ